MKRIISLLILTILMGKMIAQNTDNLPNWIVYKIYVTGIQDSMRADYLARGLEKNNLVIFSAFSYSENFGYVILDSQLSIELVNNYIDGLSDKGYKFVKYEETSFNKDKFLEIYYMRNNIKKEDISKSMPKYIQLGPKNELSNQLYDLATKIWEEKYLEQYSKYLKQKNQGDISH